MNIEDFSELYLLVFGSSKDIYSRKESISLRKDSLNSLINSGFKKIAFDTRRINQEIDFNPRRGLQNYHRSEKFISEATSQKIKNFLKLKKVLQDLKDKYGREPEWQDSYARVLLNALEKSLRIEEKDGDYAEGQPGIGSFDYLEELLYVRYRLDMNNIQSMSEEKLKKVILDKDENLTHTDPNAATTCEISKRDIATQSYDTLLEKLFGGVKATAENPEVERTVTITIRDKFVG
jgi:hypothetical protein